MVHLVTRSFFRNFLVKARAFWTVLRTERATPREIALAVFLGAWIGASPAVLVRTWLAAGVATLAKMNRLWAYIGAHFTANVFSAAWITLAEVQVSYRLRHGHWLALTRDDVAERGFALIGDWLFGFVLLGPLFAGLFAVLAWAVATFRLGRQAPPSSRPSSPPS